MPVPAPRRQIVELQSLRGLAACAVMLGHTLGFYVQPAWFTNAALIFNGRGAVVIFFVLSGYVLTRALQSTEWTANSVIRYWVQRAARIYPAIWCVSTFSFLYLLLLHWNTPTPPGMSEVYLTRFRPDRMTLLHITASFAGMLAFLIPPLWSLFDEIVASILMPFLASRAWRHPAHLYVLMGLTFLASVTFGKDTYYFIGLYAWDFVLGAWLAASLDRQGRIFAIFAKAKAPHLIVLLVLLTLTQYLPVDYRSPLAATIESILAVSVIGILAIGKVDAPVLRSRPMVWLGDISYSIYLMHYLIGCLLVKAIYAFETQAGVTLPVPAKGLLLTLLSVSATLLLSTLSFRFVERPGIDLGKRILGALKGSQVRTTA